MGTFIGGEPIGAVEAAMGRGGVTTPKRCLRSAQ